MKVIFASSWLSHHQLPFCKALIEETGNSFLFIACRPMPKEREKLGYDKMNDMFGFVLKTYEDDENLKKAQKLIEECDILIAGGTNLDLSSRIKSNKLTYIYSERLYKKGVKDLLNVRGYLGMLKEALRYKNKNVYLLCASAYSCYDYNLSGQFTNKAFKFGYFPENNKYYIDSLILNKKPNSIIWAGRLINWKHPDLAIKAAKRLKEEGYNFELNIIGNGEMENELKTMIDNYKLNDSVHMLGSMPPTEVRKYMEESEIYLFTSDRGEGWGVVLNEAMNSGCAVIASYTTGSTPFLVKDKVNGLIYKDDDENEFYTKLKSLFMDDKNKKTIQKNAYKTIDETWNYRVAAHRLLSLSECLLNKKTTPYGDGPCSVAERIVK